MKFLASITALILSACAYASTGVAVPPPSDFVDTEAATNVAFDAGDVYARRLDWHLQLDAQRRAKSLAALDADGSVFAANVPATMFDSAWNLMRVTTRGGVPPSGVVVSRTAVLGYGITVR